MQQNNSLEWQNLCYSVPRKGRGLSSSFWKKPKEVVTILRNGELLSFIGTQMLLKLHSSIWFSSFWKLSSNFRTEVSFGLEILNIINKNKMGYTPNVIRLQGTNIPRI